MHLYQKNILILGFGITGQSCLNFLEKKRDFFGIGDIKAYDDHENIRNTLIKKDILFDPTAIERDAPDSLPDIILLSPGIPLKYPSPHPIVQSLLTIKPTIKIMNDVGLFTSLYPDMYYVGVTGTNGKSTLVSMMHHLLKSHNIESYLCGNIGTPIFDLALFDDHQKINACASTPQKPVYIIELSSYHLETLSLPCFDMTVITNITPDHMDRYETFDDYAKTKRHLWDLLRPNYTKAERVDRQLMDQSNKHSLLCLAGLIGIKNQEHAVANTMTHFKNLPHRHQLVFENEHIRIINDSKATNINAALYALRRNDNILWIAGGDLKNQSLHPLMDFMIDKSTASKVLKTYCIGESASHFIGATGLACPFSRSKTLVQAMRDIQEDLVDIQKKFTLKSGPVTILLSPACASFDQYKNFAERGEEFCHYAQEMIIKPIQNIKNKTDKHET